MASAVMPASMPPAAPSVWPVIDLVDDIASFLAWSPNTFLTAIVSFLSLRSAEVPCALMYVICDGSTFASAIVSLKHACAPRCSGAPLMLSWTAVSGSVGVDEVGVYDVFGHEPGLQLVAPNDAGVVH